MADAPRVLIVEDERHLRRALAASLAGSGFRPSEAGSLGEAHELLGRGRFDAFVLDVALPDGDGLSLLGRAEPDRTLVITAHPEPERFRALGVHRYLTKPMDLLCFRDALRALADEVRTPSAGPRPCAPVQAVSQREHKILLYSHDTAGLGNIRRTLALAETLREGWPRAAILIVTGSPVIHSFRIPDGVDYVKLPCLDRVGPDRYAPKFLATLGREVRAMRRTLLRRAVVHFAPDLLVVDKRPGGIGGELLEGLRLLRAASRSTRLVLGMRDILDAPERARRALAETGCFATLERFYHEVWVYGSREVFDPVVEYGFPEPIARRTHLVGYLGRRLPRPIPGDGVPRVLVTTGGGGDGSPMIEAYLEGLARLPRRVAVRSTVVLGPEMPATSRDGILRRYGHFQDVEFVDFEPDLGDRLARVDAVVSMAGYATVCEILASGRPALLVPRCRPVTEQWVRARRLAALGCVRMLEPAELSPRRLLDEVLHLLESPPVGGRAPDLGGLERVRHRVAALLESEADA